LTVTTSFRSLLTVTAALLLGLGGSTAAAEPAPTTLTIPSMDSPNCAKKVAAKLSEVPGVAKVETDPDTGTVKVTPQAKAVLSPKALWEAAEKAKYKPTKLEGPGGTFTERPKA
jgi:Cu+-exporting ATPase